MNHTFNILNNLQLSREPIGRKPSLIIFDFDGTLNILTNPTSRFDWSNTQQCLDAMASNPPNWLMISLANALHTHFNGEGVAIIVATGRPEEYRSVTSQWLKDHKVRHDDLWMRPTNDDRPDAEVKRAMLSVLRETFEIWFVVEDRASVTSMWRQEGILCLQCAEGNY